MDVLMPGSRLLDAYGTKEHLEWETTKESLELNEELTLTSSWYSSQSYDSGSKLLV